MSTAQQPILITTPIGRAVSGSPTTGYTTDDKGQQLVIKNGPNAGQPKTDYYMGLAIPKTAGVDWKSEPWGQQMVVAARRDHPAQFDPATGQIWAGRQFSWKVTDGDSSIPNKKNNKPCDNEGWSGNWVIHFSTSIAPTMYRWDTAANRAVPLDHPVKLGDYFQARYEVLGNTGDSPGLYTNPNMYCFVAFGKEIVKRANANPDEAGFGVAPGALPQGASMTPVGGEPVPAAAQPQVAPPPPPVVTPAHDLVQPQVAPPPPPVEENYTYNGKTYTKAALLAMPGWTEALIATHCQRV